MLSQSLGTRWAPRSMRPRRRPAPRSRASTWARGFVGNPVWAPVGPAYRIISFITVLPYIIALGKRTRVLALNSVGFLRTFTRSDDSTICIYVCVCVAHTAALRTFWTDWYPRKLCSYHKPSSPGFNWTTVEACWNGDEGVALMQADADHDNSVDEVYGMQGRAAGLHGSCTW